jgi:hypothetical protein
LINNNIVDDAPNSDPPTKPGINGDKILIMMIIDDDYYDYDDNDNDNDVLTILMNFSFIR